MHGTGKANWFSIRRVSDDVYLVRERFYRESANLYLVKGSEKDLLIDTGTGLGNIKLAIEHLSKDPMVINTHVHFDHSGGNRFFDCVRIHLSERKMTRNPTRRNTGSYLMSNEDFLAKPFRGFNVAKYRVQPASKVKALLDCDVLDLGSFKFRVMHTPGHSPGSICLYDSKKGVLFSGDTIYEGELYYDLPYSNVDDYSESLMKISELWVRVVFPGHNELMDRARFKTVLRNSVKMLRSI